MIADAGVTWVRCFDLEGRSMGTDGGWMGFGQGQSSGSALKTETLSLIPFPKRDPS